MASAECTKFSEDVKHWAEFQTGVKVMIMTSTKIIDKTESKLRFLIEFLVLNSNSNEIKEVVGGSQLTTQRLQN